MSKKYIIFPLIAATLLFAGAGCNTPVKTAAGSMFSATDNVKEFVVTAKNWEFDPGTIAVNKGDKVRLKITSIDVEHGFGLKDFNVNVKLPVGETTVVEFVADKAGTFDFHCTVPCGLGHREMAGKLVVQ